VCATQELLKLADKTAFTHCLAVVYTNHSEKEFVTGPLGPRDSFNSLEQLE